MIDPVEVDALPANLRNKIRVDRDGCWMWTGCIWTHQGYGKIGRTVDGKWHGLKAHRVVWEYFHGPWPDGLVSDHVCHDPRTCPGGITCPHRRCVNPGHISAVPAAANSAATRTTRGTLNRTHCLNGHEYTEQTTYWKLEHDGKRHPTCRLCVYASNNASYSRNRDIILARRLARRLEWKPGSEPGQGGAT